MLARDARVLQSLGRGCVVSGLCAQLVRAYNALVFTAGLAPLCAYRCIASAVDNASLWYWCLWYMFQVRAACVRKPVWLLVLMYSFGMDMV